MNFLKLIRYQNLLLLAFMQLVLRYGFLNLQNVPLALNDWQYILLITATVLIAAGGYVINNIFDQETDIENKPKSVIVGKKITEAKAYNYYVLLNIIGVGIGFYLSNVIDKPGFASIFIFISALLYLYASSLKQMVLIGNIIVAILLAFSVIIIGVFDLYPITNSENQAQMANLFSILLDYALFAFVLNFIREIVKDLEDINGDKTQSMNTLPIIVGIKKTTKIAFVLGLVIIGILLNYTNLYFVPNNLNYATIYMLLFLIGPLIYFILKVWNATTTKEFNHLSSVLKLILLFGVILIPIITYNIKNHA